MAVRRIVRPVLRRPGPVEPQGVSEFAPGPRAVRRGVEVLMGEGYPMSFFKD